jgi:hypothetical protein
MTTLKFTYKNKNTDYDKDTITLNGIKIGKGKKSIVDSLFSVGGTANFYYRVFKRHIGIYNVKDEKVFFINEDGLFGQCSKQHGSYWYMHCINSVLIHDSYTTHKEECEEALKKAKIKS